MKYKNDIVWRILIFWIIKRKLIFFTKWTRICSTCVSTSRSFPYSWLITGFVTRLTRRVSPVEQELHILPKHLSSSPIFILVGSCYSIYSFMCMSCRSVFFIYFFLSFCPFSFCHCVVCPLIYGFWLPLWFLQTLLIIGNYVVAKHTSFTRALMSHRPIGYQIHTIHFISKLNLQKQHLRRS